MAVGHGLAGQYGKDEATNRLKRLIYILTVVIPWVFVGYGFVWGYFWYRWGALPALIPFVAVVGVTWIGWRYVEPYMDKVAKDRIKFLRGGQAEALVAWILKDAEDNWHIFNAIKLEADSDIDHVLIGPGGLYCISTKSHRGLFTGTPDGLLHNGKPCPFAQDALRDAMRLKDRLAGVLGADVPWIQPVLALPFGYIEGDGCGGKVWLVHQDTLLDRLAPTEGPKRLAKPQVERTIKALEMIQSTAAAVYRRPEPTPAPAR